MSLNELPSAIHDHLPKKDAVDSLPTGGASSSVNKQSQQLNESTNELIGSEIPGEFPGDEAGDEKTDQDNSSTSFSVTAWMRSLVPTALDKFESSVKGLVRWVIPPPRQAALYEAAISRPIATTFITCQLICCGVPLLVFLSGILLFAAVAILLWALLSFLILGPILVVTSLMGVSLWGWGWVIYGLIKWADEMFLGGLITRFWLSQAQAPIEDHDGPQGEEKERKQSSTR